MLSTLSVNIPKLLLDRVIIDAYVTSTAVTTIVTIPVFLVVIPIANHWLKSQSLSKCEIASHLTMLLVTVSITIDDSNIVPWMVATTAITIEMCYHYYHTQHFPSLHHQFSRENIMVKEKSVGITIVFTIKCPIVDPIQRSILNPSSSSCPAKTSPAEASRPLFRC